MIIKHSLLSVVVPPNQSLKLTEPAVDDFAARGTTSYYRTGLSSRGLDTSLRLLRRRSLAPVR